VALLVLLLVLLVALLLLALAVALLVLLLVLLVALLLHRSLLQVGVDHIAPHRWGSTKHLLLSGSSSDI